MKMNGKKNNINFKNIVICILFLLIGVLIGTGVTFLLIPKNTMYNNKPISLGNKFDSLTETYETIKENYYKDVKDEDLINGAIDGMMKSLKDEHSMFFDKENKKEFEDELSGSYYGIGAEIKQISEEEVMINKVFDDSPADKAGLKSGDVFVSIDGKSTKGLKVSEIAKNLKSDKKDTATIIIKRDGEEKTFKVQKDNVNLLSVSSEMLDGNIGYISVSIFGEKTYTQFTNALKTLEKDNMKSLIIDLRGNSGGYLSTVTQMLSEFLPQDKVIYQMKTREGITKYNSINSRTRNYKVIILVDENSASASEIMASGMQEQYKATLVGVTTYGKGTVQETQELSNGTLIKYTVQEWLTSNGKSINGTGVKPDVEVELSKEYEKSSTRENDNQFQKALELAK
ncbi:MAG: S41 family peptidase [Bacilli bacterium]|nr:S41 family peptidase [Bacilli bacterium]